MNQHRYLSFLELPIAMLSLFDLIIYPLVFAFIVYSSFFTGEYTTAIMFYFLLPFCFILIMDKELKENSRLIPFVFLTPIMFNVLSFIEFAALVKTMYRIIIVRKDITWTNWVRVGV